MPVLSDVDVLKQRCNAFNMKHMGTRNWLTDIPQPKLDKGKGRDLPCQTGEQQTSLEGLAHICQTSNFCGTSGIGPRSGAPGNNWEVMLRDVCSFS